jgi:predicted lipoprotein with Yx(FWY)xxD motif
MRIRTLPIGLGLSLGIIAAACGGGATPSPSPSSAPPSVVPPSSAPASELPSDPPSDPPASVATGDITVQTATADLGTILVDGEGMTLYAFTPDTAGVSTCYDDCASAWPPLVVQGDITVGSGLDDSTFTLVARTDGSQQLKAGDWPLYLFSGDMAAGDTNGQGLSNVWYVVDAEGALIR